jgi:hypothetical protein
VAIAGEFYRKLVDEHAADPGNPALIVGRLLSDGVAAGDPAVKISPAGNPVTVRRLLEPIKNQNPARGEGVSAGSGRNRR